MAKLTLHIEYEEQSRPDTLAMFLWGDGFLARIVRNGKVTDETLILRIDQIVRANSTREAVFITNYGKFHFLGAYLEQVD